MAVQRHCPVKLKQMSLLPSSVRIWYTEENVRLFKGQKEDGANRGEYSRTYLFIMADIHTDHAEDSRDASNRLKSDIDSSRHDRKIRKKNQNSLRKRQQHMRVVYLIALAAVLVVAACAGTLSRRIGVVKIVFLCALASIAVHFGKLLLA